MAPAYTSYAFIAAGQVGGHILDNFLADGNTYELRVLTRPESVDRPALAAFASKGVKIIPVDYSSQDSLFNALQGVEVAICGLSKEAVALQSNVVYAAKAAGLKLFVPTEFGKDTRGNKHPYVLPKASTHPILEKLQLPYTLFFSGYDPRWFKMIGDKFGFDFAGGNFKLSDEGNIPVSLTTPADVATFVHRVLITQPADKLANGIYRIEGDRKTIREIIAVWETKHDRTANITLRTPEEHEAYRTKLAAIAPLDFMFSSFLDGTFNVQGGDAYRYFPDWKPVTLADVCP